MGDYLATPEHRQRELLRALADAGKALTSNLSLDQVLGAIMSSVASLLQPNNWSLFLLDEKKERLRFELVVGEAADRLRGMTLATGEGIAGWVAQHGRPLIVDKASDDPRFARRFDVAAEFVTESILCVPLIARGNVLGVIELIKAADDPKRYGAADLDVLEPLADFAAIAIQNANAFAKTERLTLIDDLTQLGNSRCFSQSLGEEIVRAERYGRPLSLLFLDLDHFKRVNDTFGHDVGSRVLAEVGRVIKRSVRSTDRAVRWGGDEFAALLPETDREGAREVACRLREALRQVRLPDGSPITASIGVAAFPDDGRDGHALKESADRAMYGAKAAGRDVINAAACLPSPATSLA